MCAAPLVWVDLEMTGLDPSNDVIVEIATLVTTDDLTVVGEGPNLVIHQPDDVLARMRPVVVEMHARSGLTERIRASTVSLEQAEEETVAFLRKHVAPKESILAGNSVWKDRQFLERWMPRVVELLHYRMVDVSTVKELARRWAPSALQGKKAEKHRALDDIKESIEELRHYKSVLFKL